MTAVVRPPSSGGPVGPTGGTGATGGTGPQGTAGTAGAQGTTGTGPQGTQGVQGTAGPQGTQGVQGTQGTAGIQGSQGTAGAQGTQGIQGTAGGQGAQGTQGTTGTQGAAGTQGATGTQGVAGTQGGWGTTGTQGAAGTQGASGTQGGAGTQGTTGAQGGAGTQGATGTQGGAGTQGTQGAVGTQGAAGGAGTQGTTGTAGATGPTEPYLSPQYRDLMLSMVPAGYWRLGAWTIFGQDEMGAFPLGLANHPDNVAGLLTGDPNGAGSFNGTGHYMDTAAPVTTNVDNWTMACWFLPVTDAEYKTLMYNGSDADGYGLWVTPSNTFLCSNRGGSGPAFSSAAVASTTVPTFAVLLRRSGTAYLYLNGVLDTVGDSGAPNTPTGQTMVGVSYLDQSGTPTLVDYFHGTIDEPAIWDRALTADEIAALYNCGTAVFHAALQGAQGTQGTTGTQGAAGASGAQGTWGTAGTGGATGTTGTAGAQGTTGAQGTQGVQGTAGTQGTQGTAGATGATGPGDYAGTITALTAASAALGADELPINEAGTSKKLTVAQIQALIASTAPLDLWIGPYDPRLCGGAQTAWPTANKAFYLAFQVNRAVTVTKAAYQTGGTANGNIDLGIYADNGTFLGSTGSTAVASAYNKHTLNLTGSVSLVPGVKYWAAIACSSATNTLYGMQNLTAGQTDKQRNVAQVQTSAFPLPTGGATFAEGLSIVPYLEFLA